MITIQSFLPPVELDHSLLPISRPASPPSLCFFFTAPPTPEIYTLSLHDALPILDSTARYWLVIASDVATSAGELRARLESRSEEHTSELQSPMYLVCRLLLEKKKHTTSHRTLHLQTTY